MCTGGDTTSGVRGTVSRVWEAHNIRFTLLQMGGAGGGHVFTDDSSVLTSSVRSCLPPGGVEDESFSCGASDDVTAADTG